MADEDLERRFDAMMRRINDNHERVLLELRNLGTKTDVAREFIFRVPKLVGDALEAGLLMRFGGIEDVLSEIRARLTAIEAKLEKPSGPGSP